MSAERIAAHQRGRLEGAMVEAVARRGYEGVTIAELVGLAGVSKRDFYRHFEGKEECFLATFEEIVEAGATQIGEAYRRGEGREGRMAAGVKALAQILLSEPAAASLALVDSLALGPAGVACRAGAAARFEAMIAQSFGEEPQRGVVSELEVRAIVAGIRRVAYRSLRNREQGRLQGQVGELVEWALAYQRPERGGAMAPAPAPPRAKSEGLGWEEPPSSERSRAELTQRERIVRAVAQFAAEEGYAALNIPAISARAGTSNEAYYANFASTQEAFFAAFEALSGEVLGVTAAAFGAQESWPATVGAGVAALLGQIAANPIFARLAFFELAAAGPVGLERADLATDRFTAFLEPGALPAGVEARPAVVVEAIGGGIWAVIQHEIAHGRAQSLPALAPQIVDFVLVPFGV